MTIRSRPSNDDYRREHERIFGKPKGGPVSARFRPKGRRPNDWNVFAWDAEAPGGIYGRLTAPRSPEGDLFPVDGWTGMTWPINPHDADEHPAAD